MVDPKFLHSELSDCYSGCVKVEYIDPMFHLFGRHVILRGIGNVGDIRKVSFKPYLCRFGEKHYSVELLDD